MKNRFSEKCLVVPLLLIVLGTANATTISADQLLGKIAPGTPADEDNVTVMISFLVTALNSGNHTLYAYPGAGFNLGDNLSDPKPETYTLWAPNGLSTPAPLPAGGGWKTDTSSPIINLGIFQYDYLLAKFGNDSAVFWIGNLSGEIEIPNLINKSNLSNYTLVNKHSVPDGGMTALLLAIGLGSVFFAGRRFNST